MMNRREFFGLTLGAGATLALTPQLLRAFEQAGGKLIQRAHPSSGEMFPIIGLGRGSRPADPAALKEVLRALGDNGAKLVDTVHGGAQAQEAAGAIAGELGSQSRTFWSTPVSVAGDPAAVKAQLEASFARLKVPRIDLVMVIAIGTSEISTNLAVLQEMKKEGRIRYIGVTDLLPPPFMNAPAAPTLATLMRNEPIDFVGFDYCVAPRPFQSGPPSSTRRPGRSSSSRTSSATRPSPWRARARATRRTCWTTSAAASAGCRTRRRGSEWRTWWTRGRRTRGDLCRAWL
jgi:hypothetical protein